MNGKHKELVWQVSLFFPTPRIPLSLRPSVRPSRFVPHLTHTIVWCESVSNGMEVDKVTDEVADEVANMVAGMVVDNVPDEVAD